MQADAGQLYTEPLIFRTQMLSPRTDIGGMRRTKGRAAQAIGQAEQRLCCPTLLEPLAVTSSNVP